MTHRPVFLLAAAATLAACAAPAASPAPAPADPMQRAALTITPEDMRARIGYLASDALLGRDTPSPGLDSAAAYLVREFQRLGLQPAGEGGTYIQRYPFPLRRLSAGGTRLSVAGPGGAQALRMGEDFFARGGTTRDLVAPLVFIGTDSSLISGEGVLRDKIAVAVLSPENGREFRLLRNRQVNAAERAGAAGIVHVLGAGWTPEQIREAADASTQPARALGVEPGFPEFFVTHRAGEAMFTAAGLVLDELAAKAAGGEALGTTLSGLTVTAGAPLEELDRGLAPNVLAVLPGSDPELRDEYVVFSSHMDHVGVGEPVNGDSIYNGADDDASGTSALVEVAEAFAALPTPPRRSVVFLAVSGEEKGLLGSRWYSDHPTIPLEQTVANINVDMISRNSPDSVVVIGKDYSSLGNVVNAVGARHPELGLTVADDIWPEERFFFRSDHFNFARKEIPAIFFFTGVHEDYHQPSDEVESIDPDKAARVARLIFYTAAEIANADTRPVWDPEGLEEVRALTR